MTGGLEKPLIVFKGGGYSGCHWEWNVLIFERRVKFTKAEAIESIFEHAAHQRKLVSVLNSFDAFPKELREDIITANAALVVWAARAKRETITPLQLCAVQPFVTGAGGDRMLEFFQEEGTRTAYSECRHSEDSYERSAKAIRTQADWLKFCAEWNCGLVRSVAKHLKYEMPCQDCHKLFPAEEIAHTSYRGNGGVGVNYLDNVCETCAYEKHADWFKGEWRRMGLKERMALIKRINHEIGEGISFLAARHADKVPRGAPDMVHQETY